MNRIHTLGAALCFLGACCLSGCAYGDASGAEDPVGEAQQAQLDPGYKNYLIYTITNATGLSLGQLLVTGATAGDGFDANTEYWYLTSNLSNSATVTFTSGVSQYWSTVPTVGTLSFKTERTPTWTSTTPRGSMLLESYPLTGEKVGINWQMTETGGVWSGSIYWYHSSTGNLFGPSQTNTLSPGTVPSGTWYEYTTSPL